MKKILEIIILWCITLSVYAAPVLYNLSGQIRQGTAVEFEDFTGTFVLADPTILDRSGSTNGDYYVRFSITDFSLTSATYTLTQAGTSWIQVWWIGYPTPTEINGLDSCMSLATSVGTTDCTGWQYYGGTTYNGDWDAQPTSIVNINDVILGGGYYRISGMTATVVPVPATVWLFGSGLLGLVGTARRKKTA